MERGADLLRRAALIAAAALALHELRYVAGYGDAAGATAAAQGHGYLPWTAGLIVALVVAAASAFTFALFTEFRRLYGRAPAAASRRAGFPRSWVANSAALAVIYSLQELAEGMLAHGHPVGLDAILGHAGWTAYVFALVLGALVTLALRGAREAIALAARVVRVRGALPRAARSVPRPPLALPVPRAGLLGRNLAGRAPPACC